MGFTKEGINSNTVYLGPKVGKAPRDIHHRAWRQVGRGLSISLE